LIKGPYAIVDNTYCPQTDHVALAHLFLKGGARLLQLRMKGERDLKKITRTVSAIMEFKKAYDFTFIVNDHAAVAREIGADGEHGGADDLPIQEARVLLGKGFLIGYSAHSIEEALEAERRGADYVAFGAIFPTRTKPVGHPVQGLEKLRELVKKTAIPVVAIGGIHRKNLHQVLETGVASVAMIGALTQAQDVTEEVKWYCQAIKSFSLPRGT